MLILCKQSNRQECPLKNYRIQVNCTKIEKHTKKTSVKSFSFSFLNVDIEQHNLSPFHSFTSKTETHPHFTFVVAVRISKLKSPLASHLILCQKPLTAS